MPETGRLERLLIDGRLVPASDGGTFDNINPATARVLGATADGTAADLAAAVGAARTAFDETSWSGDPFFRAHCLRQLQQALMKNAERLKADLVAEIGTPVILTAGPQFDTPVEGIGWFADLAEEYSWENDLGEAIGPDGASSRRWTRREPVGVVGAITPWNFPTQINLAKIAPALAAGCTVVLKPAPDSPWAATSLGRIAAEETDIPAGVLNVVASARHETGRRLVEDPRVDMVSFTGSTTTGRAVMTAAAGSLKKVFLELGGKSALVALDDADPATAAVTAAFHITTHAGQGCAILTRLLVPRARYDDCLAALVETLRGWPCGDPTDPGTLMGPLISEHQRRRVLGYIERGVAEGARIALGGGIPEALPGGWFVEPTVLADVGEHDTVAQEEIFGPVICVIPYDGGDDEAVRIANNSAYGLSGGVLSASPERARAVAKRLRVGTVSVNAGNYYGFDVPFGGYRQSGIGRESGVAGFEEYLEIKSMAERI
ncbi:aldehyde dehydrogenase family protein [Streptomyces sp. NPDC056716]|uniref:aldehyde dehydrogenase family protein n=1 Tax=unclassified Streptomyces TaxID=2593676 RepID=UPI00367ED271